MKFLKKENLLLQFIGIFIGRITIGGINPIAISFFVAMYPNSKGGLLSILFILIGMLTVLPIVEVIKYLIVMITIMVIASLFEYKKKQLAILPLGIIAGIITTSLSLTNSLLSFDMQLSLVLALAEGLAVFAFSVILRQGIEAILNGRTEESFSNEEMISIGILLFALIYGLPKVGGTSLALHFFVAYFTILFTGYKYGAGYGTLMGVACGAVLGLMNGDFAIVGVFCMLGILSGTFRELGRLTVTIMFSIGTMVLFGLLNGIKIDFEELAPLITGSLLFLILPDSIAFRSYSDRETVTKKDSFANQNIQTITKDKLRGFSESFFELSKTFHSISEKKIHLTSLDKENIFNDLSEQLCQECINCDLCWEQNSQDTYQGVNHIMEAVEKNGVITINQVPNGFRGRCIQLEKFILETRRIFDLAKININYHNKLAEGREAIAEQFTQIGYILDDFSHSLYKTPSSTKDMENKIIFCLKNNYVYVNNITIFEKPNYRKEIYIYACTYDGHCVTTKEIAQIISETIGKPVRPSESSKTVITKNLDKYIFIEDTNYKIITGVTKMTKEGSLVSGDNYSFIRSDSGTAVMTLSDGMGTGERAYEDSESVINLLEQFIEAGFSKEAAIKLINSVMVIKSEEQTFSTMDMSVINLYTGMCDFIKLGASTTFIKRGKKVEVIQSRSLPLGMINQLDYEADSKKLQDGDFIIMITDGIIDCIPGEEKEELLESFIKELNMNNPKEIANAILNYSLEINKWTPKDDMTVLVGGFWKKY